MLFTCGAANDNFGIVTLQCNRSIETVTVSKETTPHVALHRREEWEAQSVAVHDEPASERRDDKDVLPKTPDTSNIELPVEANVLGEVPLTFTRVISKAETVNLKSRRETTNEKLPIE